MDKQYKIFLFLLLNVISGTAVAQSPPVISRVTPQNGKTGTAGTTMIDIYGSNFGNSFGNNKVYVGKMPATILAVNGTSYLKVLAPTGVTEGNITVTKTSSYRTGYAYGAFAPSFANRCTSPVTLGAYTQDVAGSIAPSHIFPAGDLNGDGKPDVFAFQYNQISSNTTKLYCLTNTSTVGSVSFNRVGFVSNDCTDADIADFDANGENEMLVCSSSSVILTSIANASFSTLATFSVTNCSDVKSADFDGDGLPDFVVTRSGNTSTTLGEALVFKNESPGATNYSFTQLSGTPVPATAVAGTNYTKMGIADFNQDGLPDLIILGYAASGGANTFYLFKNTSVPGTISFDNPIQLSLSVNNSPLGNLVIADLNQDKYPDLAISTADGRLMLFKNNSSAGSISFGSGNLFDYSSTGFTPTFGRTDFLIGTLQAADMNGDGIKELVLTRFSDNANAVRIFSGITTTGNTFSFGAVTSYSGFGSSGAMGPLVMDLDGDGKSDILSGADFGGQFYWRVNSTAIVANPVINTISQRSGPTGSSGSTALTINGTGLSTNTSNSQLNFGNVYRSVTSASASTSLTVTVPPGGAYRPLQLYDKTCSAYSILYKQPPFDNTFTKRCGVSNSFFDKPFLFATGQSATDMEYGDFDGDGQQDLVVIYGSANQMSVVRGNSNSSGRFSASSSFTPQNPLSGVVKATGVLPSKIVIGDFNADGKPDIAVSNRVDGSVSFYRNTSTAGNISFADQVVVSGLTLPGRMETGDLNNDGLLDVLVISTLNSVPLAVISGLSASSSSIAMNSPYIFGPFIRATDATIVDIDGDGYPEICYVDGTTSINLLKILDSNGKLLTNFSSTAFSPPAFTNYMSIVRAGDFDADGKMDILLSCSTNAFWDNTISMYVFKNTATPGTINSSSLTFSSYIIAAGKINSNVEINDIDGDGMLDIIGVNNTENTISIYKNQTKTVGGEIDFTRGYISLNAALTDSSPVTVRIVDLNKDGRADISVLSGTNGTLLLLNSNCNKAITPYFGF